MEFLQKLSGYWRSHVLQLLHKILELEHIRCYPKISTYNALHNINPPKDISAHIRSCRLITEENNYKQGCSASFQRQILLIVWGSIGCALAPKLCGGVGTYEISKTQKAFGEIPSNVKVIQIIKFFNGALKSNLRKSKN